MHDGRESEERLQEGDTANWRIEDVRRAIPLHLHQRQTWRGLAYYFRDVAMVAAFWYIATQIEPAVHRFGLGCGIDERAARVVSWLCWVVYWVIQGFALTSLWVIGHECGHGGISDNRDLCDTLGFAAHSFLLTPYFSWKISHHRHHMYHGSMERDVVFIPLLKGETELAHQDSPAEDTPIYTLLQLIRRQLIALPAYLLWNATGPSNYPLTTSHFNPRAVIFKRSQQKAILLSDAGVLGMVFILHYAARMYGFGAVVKYYGIPWLFVNHWIAMITYLHHTDPTLPHYRGAAWSYTRGALATLDRDFLGWIGRFFFHDVSHYHVIHHLFPKMPFYNAREATEYLKAHVGKDYRRSDKPVFQAMWENYNDCVYVDDSGGILYFRNKHGERATPRT